MLLLSSPITTLAKLTFLCYSFLFSDILCRVIVLRERASPLTALIHFFHRTAKPSEEATAQVKVFYEEQLGMHAIQNKSSITVS